MPSDLLNRLWSELRFRTRAIFRRGALEREFDDELRFHVEREAAKSAGMEPDEAFRRARVAFGGVEQAKESSRDARGISLYESFTQDLRHTLRGVRLGVSRKRLLTQLLTESLVLATLGGAAGLVVAHWGGAMLGTLFLPGTESPGAFGDVRTLAFAGAAVLATGLLRCRGHRT